MKTCQHQSTRPSLWEKLQRSSAENASLSKTSSSPAHEQHLLLSQPYYHHPYNDIAVSDNKDHLKIIANIGLLSQHSALPEHYLDRICKEMHLGQTALLDFINLFNNRLISLQYFAWKKSRLYLRAEISTSETPYKNMIRSLSHEPTDNESIPSDKRLTYAGILQRYNRTSRNLSALIRHYFAVKCQITENIGQWIDIDSQNQSCLGSVASTLGKDTLLGDRHWSIQYKIKIELGSLSLAEYQSFLPGKQNHKLLLNWLKHFLPNHICFDLYIQLKSSDIGELKPDQQQLGYTTWLKPLSKPTIDQPLYLGEHYVINRS